MPADANVTGVEELLLKVQVVAVCDNAATSGISLGRLFGFTANYTPLLGIRYTLSIPVTKDTTVHTTFTSNNITSLNKIVYDRQEKDCMPLFDEISGYLDYHRSFVCLHFQLPHHRDLFTPATFDPTQCRPDVRSIFDVFALFTTTTAFSLYMPVDSLPKKIYQKFYNDLKQRAVDVRSMYKGEGGVKFDLARYRSANLMLESVPATGTVDCSQGSPASHECYKTGDSLPPASPASTVSEIDTVAVSTPSAYNNDRGKDHGSNHGGKEQDLPPPPYCNGVVETNLKHGLNSDEADMNLHQRSKRSRLIGTDDSSPCMSLPEDQLSSACETHALKLRIHKQQQQIEEQAQQIQLLWAAITQLRSQTDDLEEVQGSIDERFDSADVRTQEIEVDVGEVELKCDMFTEELSEIRQVSEQWTDMVDGYLEAGKDNVEAEMLEHVKLHLDEYVEKKHANLQQAVNMKHDLRRILNDVLND